MLKSTTIALKGRLCSLLVFMVFLFGANLTLNAQSDPLVNQAQIVEFLGQTKFNELLSTNPSYLTFLDTRCSSGYKIIDMSKEKAAEFELIDKIQKNNMYTSPVEAITAVEFVQAASSPNFNFLQYSFLFDSKEMTYYKLGSTGKVLMIFPVGYIAQLIKSKANSND